jgi:hypothetical protein
LLYKKYMNSMNNMSKIKISVGIALLVVLGYLAFVFDIPYSSKVTDFASCVSAGNPVMESFPRQCRDREGTLYTESPATGDLSTLIRVTVPTTGASVSSPISVQGTARGTWYFEASFPIVVLNSEGVEIGHGIATAKEDWMTMNFVPFEGSIVLSGAPTETGTIVFKKDNPSGDPALDLSYSVPVSFSANVKAGAKCVVSGCSSEICSDSEVMSTCQFRPEYACYAKARCERLSSGVCGWNKTPEYKACINNINQ